MLSCVSTFISTITIYIYIWSVLHLHLSLSIPQWFTNQSILMFVQLRKKPLKLYTLCFYISMYTSTCSLPIKNNKIVTSIWQHISCFLHIKGFGVEAQNHKGCIVFLDNHGRFWRVTVEETILSWELSWL